MARAGAGISCRMRRLFQRQRSRPPGGLRTWRSARSSIRRPISRCSIRFPRARSLSRTGRNSLRRASAERRYLRSTRSDLPFAHGFAAAVLRASVGSVIDPVFEGRHAIHSDSTELLVRSGSVKPDQSGALRSELDISLVDTEGRLHEGRIARGCNPVCITFELMMEELASI